MKRGSDPAKVQQWRERFDRFGRSGQTVARFCNDESVSVPSFYQWKKKLKRGGGAKSPGRRSPDENGNGSVFRRLELTSAGAAPSVTIRIPGGIEILLGNDLPAIGQVVGQLLDRQPGTMGDGSC